MSKKIKGKDKYKDEMYICQRG
uniref:Uncharacterized protein n=1 Tax=Anguilla anguilla TaxID=7936 RepID=A0A0E9XDK5_ANGAN